MPLALASDFRLPVAPPKPSVKPRTDDPSKTQEIQAVKAAHQRLYMPTNQHSQNTGLDSKLMESRVPGLSDPSTPSRRTPLKRLSLIANHHLQTMAIDEHATSSHQQNTLTPLLRSSDSEEAAWSRQSKGPRAMLGPVSPTMTNCPFDPESGSPILPSTPNYLATPSSRAARQRLKRSSMDYASLCPSSSLVTLSAAALNPPMRLGPSGLDDHVATPRSSSEQSRAQRCI